MFSNNRQTLRDSLLTCILCRGGLPALSTRSRRPRQQRIYSLLLLSVFHQFHPLVSRKTVLGMQQSKAEHRDRQDQAVDYINTACVQEHHLQYLDILVTVLDSLFSRYQRVQVKQEHQEVLSSHHSLVKTCRSKCPRAGIYLCLNRKKLTVRWQCNSGSLLITLHLSSLLSAVRPWTSRTAASSTPGVPANSSTTHPGAQFLGATVSLAPKKSVYPMSRRSMTPS
jgi:hypothetical protein